jgi:hypothetical protein
VTKEVEVMARKRCTFDASEMLLNMLGKTNENTNAGV